MNIDPNGTFVITGTVLLISAFIGAGIGAGVGAFYGYATAKANGTDPWIGTLIGAVTGGFMGAGAGIASLFIAPVIAGGSVIVGGTTLAAGTALGIGAGIAAGTGFIGGFSGDIWGQIENQAEVTDWLSPFISGFQWGALNTINAFAGSLPGPLTNLATAAITWQYAWMFGAIGMIIDVLKEKNFSYPVSISKGHIFS